MTCRILAGACFEREVLRDREPIVVMFGAEWSGACHIVEPVLEDLALSYQTKIRIFRLDAEDNDLLVQEYGIRALPTFLFFSDGQIVDSLTGIVSRQQLKTRLESLIHVSKRNS